MYDFLVSAHSGLRWIFLVLVLVAIVMAALSRSKSSFTVKKPALFALITAHLQLVIGLVLYFTSPKVQFGDETMSNSMIRFFSVEHIFVMLIGIILITMGYSKAKRDATSPNKKIFWFYLIGIVLILSRIPWPGMGLGAGWF